MSEYILKHWQEYNLTDHYCEFVELLAILEANGETLDSLHSVALNGESEFCGIIGKFENDRDTVKALFEYHLVWTTETAFEEWVNDTADFYGETAEEVINSEDIRRTSYGIVNKLYY